MEHTEGTQKRRGTSGKLWASSSASYIIYHNSWYTRQGLQSLLLSSPLNTMGYADKLCLGMASIYSFFGVTLLINPAFFWGPESKLSYWTVMDDSGVWFGRALG